MLSAILKEMQEIKSNQKELREFGITMSVALLIIFGYVYWKSTQPQYLILIAALLFAVFSFFAPFALKSLQKIWMSIAVVMGWAMSRIILFVLYFVVITPISICGRLSGERFLDLKMDEGKESYWINRRNNPLQKNRYEKQF